ncbi:MAG: ATP-binding protein [Mariniblastus sp.]
MKLAAKLSLVSVIAVIAVLAASNYFAAQIAISKIKRDHEAYAEKMASQMESSILDAWQSGGVEAMRSALRMEGKPPVARWVWFEESVTATTRPSTTADFSTIVTRQAMTSFVSTVGDGGHLLHTYYPVDLGVPRAGGLEFTRSLDDYDRETMDKLIESLIVVGFLSVVSILVVWFAGVRLVANPLNKLTAATKRIGEGDYRFRVELSGKDELTQLGRSINEMSARLDAQKLAIERETRDKLLITQQLRHADRLKTVGRMAASIAHEIGTPLSVVSGRAALIAKGDLSAEKVKQNAETIQSETDRITDMIRQVLNFSRQLPSEKTEVDLNEILIQVTELLTTVAERKGVAIESALAGTRALACLDGGQIRQVLTNILVNGIQAMESGGTLYLSLNRVLPETGNEGRRASFEWEIRVRDEGIGIPEENLESIFEPFFTTKDVGDGTGLGLSLAYNMIQEQGGQIEVSSELGEGSEFRIFLPGLPRKI